MKRNALADLLVACAQQAAFHTLRTREQLGYTVFLVVWRQLTVSSNRHDCAVLHLLC